MNGVNATFQIPMAFYENKQLINTLTAYILSKKTQGIESNVAPNVKHNLVESKFDFLNGNAMKVIFTLVVVGVVFIIYNLEMKIVEIQCLKIL
jgi:hypothetical protein